MGLEVADALVDTIESSIAAGGRRDCNRFLAVPRLLRHVIAATLALAAACASAQRASTQGAATQSATIVPSAGAPEHREIEKLFRSGDTAAAMQRADRAVSERPRDATMRFLRAVMLTELQRTGEAIDALTKLTEDFPDLPEPYNNLAVLQAAQGRIDNARELLETALRHDPGYVLRNARRMAAHTFRGSTWRTWLGLEDERAAFRRYLAIRERERVYLSDAPAAATAAVPAPALAGMAG
jgi:tetratricopeptide (TPR) repeat protein